MSDTLDSALEWLGIPPDEQPPDHYRLLGVKSYDDREVIRTGRQPADGPLADVSSRPAIGFRAEAHQRGGRREAPAC